MCLETNKDDGCQGEVYVFPLCLDHIATSPNNEITVSLSIADTDRPLSSRVCNTMAVQHLDRSIGMQRGGCHAVTAAK